MNCLKETLERVRIGPAVTYAGLTVWPLTYKADGGPAYLTLDDALAAGTARVTEISEQGSVPELRFTNEGDRPVLLLDGEELAGAKQNRVLNLTILAPAGKTIVIPVSCVESGRWARESASFASLDHLMYSFGRSEKLKQVSKSLAVGGGRRSDQGAVWQEVDRLQQRYGVRSPSSKLADVYRVKRQDLDGYVQAFSSAADDQVGAVFALGGRLRGVELFGRSGTLERLFEKLVRSWAMDALELSEQAHEVPPVEHVREWLTEIASASVEAHDAVGLGTDLRLTGERLAGSALVVDADVVHLCVFRTERPRNRAEDPGEEGRSGDASRLGRMISALRRRQRVS